MTYLGTIAAVVALAVGSLAQSAKDPAAALQGTWIVTSINGQAAEGGAPELTLTFSGEKYHQTLGTDVNERGTFKVDASKKPMTIDLNITEGTDAGKVQLGIIEVTGDAMRANLDTPGDGKRPADFTVRTDGIMFLAKKKP